MDLGEWVEGTDRQEAGDALLRALVRSDRGRLSGAVACAVGAVFCQLTPYLMAYLAAVELIGEQAPDTGRLFWYAIGALAAALSGSALIGVALTLSHVAAYGMLRRLRLRIADRLAELPLGRATARSSGEIGKLAGEDVERIEVLVAHILPEAVSSVAVVAVTTVWLFIVDWRMALVSLALVPLAWLGLRMATRGMGERIMEWHVAGVRMHQAMVELLHGIRVIKVFNRQADTFARTRDAVNDYTRVETAWGLSYLPGGSVFHTLIAANVIAVLPAGLWLYTNGWLGLPDLLLFLLLSLGFTAPLAKLTFYSARLREVRISAAAVAGLLDEPGLADTGQAVELGPPSIEFRAVTFSYGERPVLHDITLVMPAAKVTALVGPSGSGKSTLARLVGRFYDPQSGTVSIGGADLRDIAVAQLMDSVALVFQEPFLFRDTIRENLRLGRPGCTDEQLMQAAQAARCHDFIMALPDGYDTVVGERGGTLSGGERQRLAIARALLKDAPIVVLDEATASTDPENEAAIQEAIVRLTAGRTVLVIAHRLSTIRSADQIIVLDSGRVAEQGQHDQLAAQNGTYARMWADANAAGSWSLTEPAREEAAR